MNNENDQQSPTREQVFQAVRTSWCAETCGTPAEWSPDNASWQQCDASAFVAWEYLGGELVLGNVSIDGEDAGYHYWNRIDGNDFDLTSAQFADDVQIREIQVLADSFLRDNFHKMKPDVRSRIAVMREKVNGALAVDR